MILPDSGPARLQVVPSSPLYAGRRAADRGVVLPVSLLQLEIDTREYKYGR